MATAIAPTAASAATCSTGTAGRTGVVVCRDVNGFFRAKLTCEHLTSGRSIFVYGPWTFHDGSSSASCGSAYRLFRVQAEF
jgi:hypothetical protein